MAITRRATSGTQTITELSHRNIYPLSTKSQASIDALDDVLIPLGTAVKSDLSFTKSSDNIWLTIPEAMILQFKVGAKCIVSPEALSSGFYIAIRDPNDNDSDNWDYTVIRTGWFGSNTQLNGSLVRKIPANKQIAILWVYFTQKDSVSFTVSQGDTSYLTISRMDHQ